VLTADGHAKIHVLSGDVVGRIAAGEVIERPAAVVKELVENSLDAGSRSIVVDVKDGGLGLIRVTDDGEGMNRSDAVRAFERHATSKLRSDEDLWSIRTMGFRGEALPSIGAVSKVRLTTSTREASVGTELHLTAGSIKKTLDAAPVAGTRIDVTELFFNQPARKKFVKSIPTEFSHITRAVQQAALAWPAVHLRLTHNGQEILHYPAVASDRDRIAQVYPRTFVDQCVTVESAQPGARVGGVTLDPVQATSSRVPQDLFVNRRPVRQAAVFHAVAEGYGAFLPKGRHPRFVLFLDIDPDRVDVNVHPTKREIRFADSESIHQLVRRAVRQALGGSKSDHAVSGILARREESVPDAGRARSSGDAMIQVQPTGMAPMRVTGPREGEAQLAFASEATEPYVRVPAREVVALGQLNRTFLIVQVGGDLAVIDQHTAHERVLFERLVRAWTTRGIQAQPLLIPEPVELSPPQAALLERYRGDLEKLGLELESFGASAVLIRSVPHGLGSLDARALLQDLLDDVGQWEQAPDLDRKVRPVLASLACHGAVRAGREMELPEITRLVEDWLAEGAVTTCPHGRRTSFRLSADELEKMFGRTGW